MSRAFLKNESADDPVVIPARAPLPPGITNYVTPRGLTLLHTERDELEAERGYVQNHEPDETERTRRMAELNGRIGAINQRIATASVVNGHEHSPNPIVRFGATVSLRSLNVKAKTTNLTLTLVGVDEANAAQGLIAFTAPLARLMLGKRVGERLSLRTPTGENVLEIKAITYND